MNAHNIKRWLTAMGLGLMSCSTLANTAVTTLYTFDTSVNLGAAQPGTPLIQDAAGNLYGTTAGGGTSGTGSVYELSPAGVLTTLYEFGPRSTNTDGRQPSALVLDASGTLYGAASYGGSNGHGTIFRIASGAFTTLHTFGGLSSPDSTYNPDGWAPNGLILGTDGNLYGITYVGGPYGSGTVFRISPSGDFALLYSFSALAPNSPQANADGAHPVSLVQLGNDLYGVTSHGGAAGLGTVFQLTTGGTLTTVYSFGACATCRPVSSGSTMNADGEYPNSLMLARDGNLYGTTLYGGQEGFGIVFRMTPAGALTTLFSFTAGDGSPTAALTEGADGVFFGSSIRNTVHAGIVVSLFSINAAGTISRLYSFPQISTNDSIYPSLLPVAASPTNAFYGILPATNNTSGRIYTLTLGAASLGPATAPTFNPGAGPYSPFSPIELGDATPGTMIYYTTDGSTPTTASTIYSTPINLNANTTIRAIAAGGSYDSSPVATASYTVGPPTQSSSSSSSSSSASGGGGSFDGWELLVLGLLATLRGAVRAAQRS